MVRYVMHTDIIHKTYPSHRAYIDSPVAVAENVVLVGLCAQGCAVGAGSHVVRVRQELDRRGVGEAAVVGCLEGVLRLWCTKHFSSRCRQAGFAEAARE